MELGKACYISLGRIWKGRGFRYIKEKISQNELNKQANINGIKEKRGKGRGEQGRRENR